MTITIKENGDTKGSTTGVNVVYFFAILFLITGGLIALTGYLGGVILVIFAIIMIYIGFNHNIKAQQKKLDEYYQKYFSSCPNCQSLSGRANKYCPKCGASKGG